MQRNTPDQGASSESLICSFTGHCPWKCLSKAIPARATAAPPMAEHEKPTSLSSHITPASQRRAESRGQGGRKGQSVQQMQHKSQICTSGMGQCELSLLSPLPRAGSTRLSKMSPHLQKAFYLKKLLKMTVSNPETLKELGQARIFEDGKKRNHKEKRPAGTAAHPKSYRFISHCPSAVTKCTQHREGPAPLAHGGFGITAKDREKTEEQRGLSPPQLLPKPPKTTWVTSGQCKNSTAKSREPDCSPLAAGWIKDLMQWVPLEKITQAIRKDAALV